MKKTLFQSDKHVPVLEIPEQLEDRWKLYTQLTERVRVRREVRAYKGKPLPRSRIFARPLRKHFKPNEIEEVCETLWILIHRPSMPSLFKTSSILTLNERRKP